MRAEVRFDQFCATLLKVFVAALLSGTVAYGAISHEWEPFLVFSPLSLGMLPGYFRLLPRGGMKHGTSCACLEPNENCEIGFWCEQLQRFLLGLPILLSSVFLDTLWRSNLEHALCETLVASAFTLFCCGLLVLAVFMLVKYR